MTLTSEITTTPLGAEAPVESAGEYRMTYQIPEGHGYTVAHIGPRPGILDVSVGREDHGWWAHAEAIDITAEGDNPFEALAALREHIAEWISYLEDPDVRLTPELESQRSVADALRQPGSHWFGPIAFDF
jgi:hypothetical protein